MKTIYRISLFFNALCICYLLVRGSEYIYSKYAIMPPVKEEFQRKDETEASIEKESGTISAKTQQSVNAADMDTKSMVVPQMPDVQVALNEVVTDCDTSYIIKNYDYTTKETTSDVERLPVMYVDKTREEFEQLLTDYAMNPSLTDQEKGFEEVALNSFSEEKVVITKYYRSAPQEEDFYLMVEDDYITVYRGDLKTVYLYTDIYMQHLPEELQQEILDKKYIANEEELYNFLESYSS